MLSIWRLITVVDHRAATFPEKDPTWYAPISILLAALEIDIASICASVPIFWPVLERHFGRIFITQEVVVTREDRWPATYTDDRSELTGRLNHSRSASERWSSASPTTRGPRDEPLRGGVCTGALGSHKGRWKCEDHGRLPEQAADGPAEVVETCVTACNDTPIWFGKGAIGATGVTGAIGSSFLFFLSKIQF